LVASILILGEQVDAIMLFGIAIMLLFGLAIWQRRIVVKDN
jgi:drug/metabolite transporter (DMT)-like permease